MHVKFPIETCQVSFWSLVSLRSRGSTRKKISTPPPSTPPPPHDSFYRGGGGAQETRKARMRHLPYLLDLIVHQSPASPPPLLQSLALREVLTELVRKEVGKKLAVLPSPRLLSSQAGLGKQQARGPPYPYLATGGWACPHTPLCPAFSLTGWPQH